MSKKSEKNPKNIEKPEKNRQIYRKNVKNFEKPGKNLQKYNKKRRKCKKTNNKPSK